jgi:hypothetical protein
MATMVSVYLYKCQNCGHVWFPRTLKRPRQCKNCWCSTKIVELVEDKEPEVER